MTWRIVWVLAAALLAAGCDLQKISELEEGVASEADVKKRFGEPAHVYTEADGARTFEYPRQPEGQVNYMITIGTDGKMSALRQVLKPGNFAKVVLGMDKVAVRRLLGRPAKMQPFPLRQQEDWDWRFLDGSQAQQFTASFDAQGKVVATATVADPRENNVGGR